MLLPSAALLLSVAAAGVASSAVDFSRVPRPRIQPLSPAFSIWSVIFGMSLAHAALTAFEGASVRSAWCLSAAYALCVAWALAVRTDRFTLACAALLGALAASILASSAAEVGAYEVAADLLTSWLLVASLLGLVIAGVAVVDHPTALVATAALVAVVAGATGRPALCVGIGWACALQPQGAVLHVLGASLAFAGAVVAFFVRFA